MDLAAFGVVISHGALTDEKPTAAQAAEIIEGNKLITKVDVAWDESWVGTKQVRFFKIDGDNLEIATPPFVVPHSNGSPVKELLVWRRES